jgi:hypothetical protein
MHGTNTVPTRSRELRTRPFPTVKNTNITARRICEAGCTLYSGGIVCKNIQRLQRLLFYNAKLNTDAPLILYLAVGSIGLINHKIEGIRILLGRRS